MRYALIAVASLTTTLAANAQANTSSGRELPPFLTPYYIDALDIVGKDLVLKKQEKKDNLSSYFYDSPDHTANLRLESFMCQRDRCQVLYDNAVRYFDKLATENAGRFRKATPTEFAVEWQTGPTENLSFVARLPNSVFFSTYGAQLGRRADVAAFLAKLGVAVNHQRYDEALRMDQVQMGLWGTAVHDFARELLNSSKQDEALNVLKNLVATSPFDYQAHIEIVENTHDPAAARSSATVIYDNAEDPALVAKAGNYLGYKEPDFGALPVAGKDEGGLHVVLIALPPCDLRIVGEAARLYEKANGIPVRINRLAEDLKPGSPSRIPDQRRIQKAIIQKGGPNTEFNGWNLERYKNEFLKTVEAGSALARFSMEDFVAKLDSRPGQYDAGSYADGLTDILAKYRPQDARAMYVGLTASDIFLGDTNFVFSASVAKNGFGTSLLSYGRMMASMTGERYESRKRLAERLAKQLVPATLSALGIPRPADPTDPYSYADSIERVDQKTLTLSGPTKDALDKFR
jgi:predicted Zn-dependent protease